ncbi:hypothetical protein HYI12_06540 [Acinetobacter sp. SwsAc3]|nr:hypothetical protein [Acinetobacter sp. SwsAc3]
MDAKTLNLIDKIEKNKKDLTNLNNEEINVLKKIILDKEQYNHKVEKAIEKALSPLINAYKFSHEKPYWFSEETTYTDNIWILNLTKQPQVINFEKIIINDESKLIDHKNLLNFFKDWIIYCGNPKYYNGNNPSKVTINRAIRQVYILIDSIILNSEKIKLKQRQLNALDKPFFIDILVKLGKYGCEEGIYEYSKRVQNFLLDNIEHIDLVEYRDFLEKYPYSEPENQNIHLNLDEDQINKCRFWLYKNNAYKKHPHRKGISLRTNYFDFLYKNCISIYEIKFPIIEEFNLVEDCCDSKEYKAVPVRNEESESLSFKAMSFYLSKIALASQIINKKNYLTSCNIVSNIGEINLKDINNQVELTPLGRFVTLPSDIVFVSIKHAFEFLIEYMDEILTSIERVFIYIKNQKLIQKNEIKNINIDLFLTTKLRNIGVQQWNIKPEAENRINKIRNNEGLFNLFDVLISSLQVLIGATMARRQAEIIEMKNEYCLLPKNLDPLENNDIDFDILFENRKSGFSFEDRYREILSKPILRSIAGFIYKLQKFNNFLIKNNFCSNDTSLLIGISPKDLKISNLNIAKYNKNLDLFCDYFSSKVIEYKKNDFRRFYIRQHQLRRFFAMLFFWSKSYEGLDALRDFLGHTDTEHLYHYITENINGETLAGIKARSIIEEFQNIDREKHIENIEKLFPLLLEHYQVSEFSFLSEVETFEQYKHMECVYYLKDVIDAENKISQLIETNIIDLKPEFFTKLTEDGRKIRDFKLILTITGE